MLEQLKNIICNFVAADPESITPQSNLFTQLGLTSLDLAMMSAEIESTFHVHIPDTAYVTVRTVADLMDCIEKNR